MAKKTKNISFIVGGVIVLGVLLFWVVSDYAIAPSVNSFDECAEEYTVLKTDPPQCKTPDGRTFTKKPDDEKIDSFSECAEYYPVMESYPRRCKTPDGRTFTEEIDKEGDNNINSFSECAQNYPVMTSYPPKCKTDSGKTFTEPNCQAGTGTDVAILTIADAKEIAKESECGDRLTNSYQCNESSGTWWIDLDIEKEGCEPACVVDVKNRQAKINWRCTGFVPESK